MCDHYYDNDEFSIFGMFQPIMYKLNNFYE